MHACRPALISCVLFDTSMHCPAMHQPSSHVAASLNAVLVGACNLEALHMLPSQQSRPALSASRCEGCPAQESGDGLLAGAAVKLNELRDLCRRHIRARKLHGLTTLAVLAERLDHWSGNQVRLILSDDAGTSECASAPAAGLSRELRTCGGRLSKLDCCDGCTSCSS